MHLGIQGDIEMSACWTAERGPHPELDSRMTVGQERLVHNFFVLMLFSNKNGASTRYSGCGLQAVN